MSTFPVKTYFYVWNCDFPATKYHSIILYLLIPRVGIESVRVSVLIKATLLFHFPIYLCTIAVFEKKFGYFETVAQLGDYQKH